MVQGLAEQSGGTLVLKSAPGQGTTAEIWLPAHDATTSCRRRGAASAAPKAGAQLTILAVDDDRLILMSTVAMLEDLGHTVVAVESGERALAELNKTTFDLLLTDHAMPHMTGAQLAPAVQSRFAGLPVILAVTPIARGAKE